MGLISFLFSLQALTGLSRSLSAQFGFSSTCCFLLRPSCICAPSPWIATSPSRNQFSTANTNPEVQHCWRLAWCGLYPLVSSLLQASHDSDTLQVQLDTESSLKPAFMDFIQCNRNCHKKRKNQCRYWDGKLICRNVRVLTAHISQTVDGRWVSNRTICFDIMRQASLPCLYPTN